MTIRGARSTRHRRGRATTGQRHTREFVDGRCRQGALHETSGMPGDQLRRSGWSSLLCDGRRHSCCIDGHQGRKGTAVLRVRRLHNADARRSLLLHSVKSMPMKIHEKYRPTLC